jgi:hypothetical protein
MKVIVETRIEIEEFKDGTDGLAGKVSDIDENTDDNKTGENEKRIDRFNRHRFF